MSSSRRHFLTTLGAGLLTGACGFRPMLADNSRGLGNTFLGQRGPGSVNQALRGVYIHTPTYDGEDAALAARAFRNTMINRIGDPARPRYGIRSTLTVTLGAQGITQENFATRYQARGSLSYRLFQLDPDGKAAPKQLNVGTITSWAGYDVVNAPYSDVIAERDAIERLAVQLAELLHTRVASYFAKRLDTGQILTPIAPL